MKLRTILLILVLAPAALYGGVRGYMWYSIRDTMNRIQTDLAGLGFVQYDEIRTPILGPVGVTGVTFTPKGFNQSIRVDSILAHWKEPLEIVRLLQAFYEEKLPTKFKLSLNGIQIPTSGDLAASWDRATTQGGAATVVPTAFEGCGAGSLVTTDLRRMGYEALVLDLRLEYALSGFNKVAFFARLRSHDMMTVSVEGSFPLNEQVLSHPRMLSSVPELGSLSVTYIDDSFNKRWLAYCAQKLGKTEQRFVDDYLDGIVSELAGYGLRPSDELIHAYREHLTKATRLSININPYEPLSPQSLLNVDRDNFVEWLGIEIIAGDEPIKQIRAPIEIAAEDAEQATQQHEETFQPTPVRELPEHIGRLTRIKTKKGTVEGYLEKAGKEELTLVQNLAGGSFTFIVDVDDVTEAKVLH